MDLSNTALVNNASNSQAGSVLAVAQIAVMKKAINLQSESALALLNSVPQQQQQPALASSGSLGTRLNVYA